MCEGPQTSAALRAIYYIGMRHVEDSSAGSRRGAIGRRSTSRISLALAAAVAFVSLAVAAPSNWVRIRSEHFDLVTDGAPARAEKMLSELEQLPRVVQASMQWPGDPPAGIVRVIAFSSKAEYQKYQPSEGADAFALHSGSHSFIVMQIGGPEDTATAAHEYAHIAFERAGLKLPHWLDEGLAEVFAAVKPSAGGAVVGSWRTSRRQLLLHSKWMPLSELLRFAPASDRDREHLPILYAESWALAHMLVYSPAYAPRIDELLRRPERLPELYGKTPEEVQQDLHAWIDRSAGSSHFLPLDARTAAHITTEELARPLAELAVAEMELAGGRIEPAREAYARLETELPDNPELQGALGRIALAEGNPAEARRRFGRALELGVSDPQLCYDYAVQARDTGVPETEVTAALRRALQLDPKMDDARYALALADFQAERFEAALQGFRRMTAVPEPRAQSYYTARAETELRLGLNEDAARSAAEARRHAANDDQKRASDLLEWMARSELTVQLSADGSPHLTRVARNSEALENWNPFVQPGDRIERRQAKLQEVNCNSGALQLTVLVDGNSVVLGIPDPSRVQVRRPQGGPFEFVCGKQNGEPVTVEYAASGVAQGIAGVLRGIRFPE